MVSDEKETPEALEADAEAVGAEEVGEVEQADEAAEREAVGGVAEEVAKSETAAEVRYARGQLQHMTIKKLKEIALELGNIPGVHGMKKDELIESIFALRGQEEAEGALALALDKTAVKQEIRGLKALRASALEAGDSAELKRVRKRIKRLKRTLRKAS